MPERITAGDGARSSEWSIAPLHVELLGGFRVERADGALPQSAWQQRRAAKTLTKLLATHRRHALHREQILDILWRDVDIASALNSFGKALHAARPALEPDLRPRQDSAYLRLRDDMLTLDTAHVVIDADYFERLAESALQLRTVRTYEIALAAYTGELLPEDRYEDWSAERRSLVSELHIRLLLGLADALQSRGDHRQAADRLRAVLQQDPTREDVHRRLMLHYAEMGARYEAVRQYQICRDVLHRKLEMAPDAETETLYQDILADRIHRRAPSPESGIKVFDPDPRLDDALRASGHWDDPESDGRGSYTHTHTRLEHLPAAMDGRHRLLARRTAEVYGELMDRLDRSGQSTESAVARQNLAMALIAMAKYDRAVHVLRQAEETYAALADQQGLRRVAAQLDLVHMLQVGLRTEDAS
jgi:DNA-binding SARP family transcriptional activator